MSTDTRISTALIEGRLGATKASHRRQIRKRLCKAMGLPFIKRTGNQAKRDSAEWVQQRMRASEAMYSRRTGL